MEIHRRRRRAGAADRRLHLSRQTPLYTASAQLLARSEQGEGELSQDTVLTDAPFDLPTIESQMAVIRSTALLRRVVDKERLINDPEFGSGPVGAGSGLLGGDPRLFRECAPPGARRQDRARRSTQTPA